MQKLNVIPTSSELLKNHPKLQAVLWDMDGTLMKTEPLHSKGTYHLHLEDCKQNQNSPLSFEEVDQICWGEIDGVIFKNLQDRGYFQTLKLEDFITTKNTWIIDNLSTLDSDEVVNPKLRELLLGLKDKNIPMAIVTSSEKALTLDLVDKLDLSKYFNFITTREDTAENKPSPMPYLHTMELLKVKPENCVIFEDSKTGTQAAISSGAFTYQVSWYLD